jgi:hypothetical protein
VIGCIGAAVLLEMSTDETAPWLSLAVLSLVVVAVVCLLVIVRRRRSRKDGFRGIRSSGTASGRR